MLLFSYQVVPRSGYKVLTTGNPYISDVERAKWYVQTVTVPNLPRSTDLEVILPLEKGQNQVLSATLQLMHDKHVQAD
jgi:hypothetical protein